MTSDLPTTIARLASESPTMPASLALGVKQYDELCRLIVCHPITPLSVAAGRLRELTEVAHAD